MIGNGTKNQFRDMRKVKKFLREILKMIPQQSVFLYFGDSANKKNPDVGYLFELLHELRPDIEIAMIQINKAKSWECPVSLTKFIGMVILINPVHGEEFIMENHVLTLKNGSP